MNGTVIAAPQTFNYFERIQERIVSFVAKNSNIGEKKFLASSAACGSLFYLDCASASSCSRRHWAICW